MLGADLEILDGVDRQGNAVDQASSIESESSVKLPLFRKDRWRAAKTETVQTKSSLKVNKKWKTHCKRR